MQTLTKKKVKIKVKNRKFKKLSMFQLQHRTESDLWGSWVNKRSI